MASVARKNVRTASLVSCGKIRSKTPPTGRLTITGCIHNVKSMFHQSHFQHRCIYNHCLHLDIIIKNNFITLIHFLATSRPFPFYCRFFLAFRTQKKILFTIFLEEKLFFSDFRQHELRPRDRTIRLSAGLYGYHLRAFLSARSLGPELPEPLRVQKWCRVPPWNRILPVPSGMEGKKLPHSVPQKYVRGQLYSELQVPE